MFLQRMDMNLQQAVVHTSSIDCVHPRDLVKSIAFAEVVKRFIDELRKQDSPLLDVLPLAEDEENVAFPMVTLLRAVAESPLEQAASAMPGWQFSQEGQHILHRFVEELYDFWRKHDRFMVLHSEPGAEEHEQRPYRTFNDNFEHLADLVRALYRDMCENITGDHPRVYRQVSAGCDVGFIAAQKTVPIPDFYAEKLASIPLIRQVLIEPPFIIDPPMNKRTGQFKKVEHNPFDGMELDMAQFLCYPARVGPLTILIYFHQDFIGLGTALANLFDLADDDEITRKPEAIYVFGAPPEHLAQYGELPTVFYDDLDNDLLVAAVPCEPQYGYFGYLKKMVLTLHNVIMMKQGRMPYHGAYMRIGLRDNAIANVLVIGDTATGKSETLEALRSLGSEEIRELRIIADDMGSLRIDNDGRVLGYGTEIGAFIRLDDLQQGYAFEQLDRAIIMSPQKVNARVVLPVTTMEEVLHGYPVDMLLYANNFENVNEDHPIIDRFDSPEQALSVFREGASMAKGTTTSSGLGHSYFANIFGPPQYRDLHEELALRTFKAAFDSGVLVAQLRTRLGIPDFETRGPEEAAKALLEIIRSNKK